MNAINHGVRSVLLALLMIGAVVAQNAAAMEPRKQETGSEKASDSGSVRGASDAYLKMIAKAGIEDEVKSLLGSHYPEFLSRFEMSSSPVRMKDGGMVLNGWRHRDMESMQGVSDLDRQSAIIIHYPDGRIFAAYHDGDDMAVCYFGDKAVPVHKVVEVWMRGFMPVLRRSDGEHDEARGVRKDLSGSSSDEFRRLAVAIWGESVAGSWDINPARCVGQGC
ncbi:MAG: hypothetical protein Q4D19_03680 [Lautropia sp.]|nr:hypothetical protein [Lautropia sp.]